MTRELEQAPWMVIAQGEIGVREMPGGDHHPRIVAYHATTTLKALEDEVAWCSSFVNWVLREAGIKGTNSAAARSWLKWGLLLDQPRRGAITVIKRRREGPDAATGSTSGLHVGFLVGSTAGSVRLLGGNQGNAVTIRAYPLDRYDLLAYRWPETRPAAAGIPRT